jgi:hypothetical protein
MTKLKLYLQNCAKWGRPGSLRADAHLRARPSALLEKTTLRGLRTRAFPAGQGRLRQLLHRTVYFRGVTAPSDAGLVKL